MNAHNGDILTAAKCMVAIRRIARDVNGDHDSDGSAGSVYEVVLKLARLSSKKESPQVVLRAELGERDSKEGLRS